MSRRALIFDVLAIVVWLAILLAELLFFQDLFITVTAVVCIFVFAALLGRDARKARSAVR